MARKHPNRSMLYWWNGDHYICFVVEENKLALAVLRGKVDEDDKANETAKYSEKYVQWAKIEHAHDGWRVSEDTATKHVAILGDAHRFWSVRNLAWLVGLLIEKPPAALFVDPVVD